MSKDLLLLRFGLHLIKPLYHHVKAVVLWATPTFCSSYLLITVPTLDCGSFLATERARLLQFQHFVKRVAKDSHPSRSIEAQLATQLE